MKVLIDLDFYCSTTETGSVYGGIWIESDHQKFPELHWTDLVSGVLSIWLHALANLIESDVDQETLHFMDGDFRVDILKVDRDVWQLHFLGSGRNVSIDFESKSTRTEVVDAVVTATRSFIGSCRTRGIESRELPQLEEGVARLQQSP